MNTEKRYQICTRCVMDTTDPEITFDKNGVCNHCTNALVGLKKTVFIDDKEKKLKLNTEIKKIKLAGKGKKYNCIVGLSGGVDSSYLAFMVKHLGLKPLAIHLDNGWNSELAVQNIENIVNKLGIDLDTYVVDWDEIKDLQRAYLRASVVDFEVISDNAIVIAINKLMKKYKIKYFISGYNIETESIMPDNWFYTPKFDGLNIRHIHKLFGDGVELKDYPLLSFLGYIYYRFFKATQISNLLNLVNYNKEAAKKVLENELDWRDYGGKHYESIVTKFYQAYILPKKFNIDKRKAHLSSLICSQQITRTQALAELHEPLYNSKSEMQNDKEYFIKKMGFSEKEFDEIMKEDRKEHFDYKSYNKFINKLKKFVR